MDDDISIEDRARLLAEEADMMEEQLHAARYAYHKQIVHKYKMLVVLPPDEAKERYRKSMENYDQLIDEAAQGHLTEADEADMAKGFG